MKQFVIFIIGLLLTAALDPVLTAHAQSTVTVIGPAPTPGNCVQWFSTTQIKDPGITCNGGAGSSPGGSNGQVQYNNAGVFGGLTNTQLTADINLATASLSGALPAWPNNTTTFFRGDGSYASPSSGSYTPPGTGGSATTIQNRLNRVIYANDYGAVCNGSTDDSTAFQNAINEAQTAGVSLRWNGACAIGTGLIVSAALDFGGVGFSISTSTTTTSRLIALTNSMSLITITDAASVNFHDFALEFGGTTGSVGIAISSGGAFNTGSIFRHLNLIGFSVCFSSNTGISWIIDSSQFTSCANYGAYIQDTINPDGGDNTIVNSYFIGTTLLAQIEYISAGGLRIVNNKLNTAGGGIGIDVNLAASAQTADLFVSNNSIEGSPVSIRMLRGAGATFFNVIISGNQMTPVGSGGQCVVAGTDTQWLSNVIVSNNVCLSQISGTNFAFLFNTPVNGLNITNNTVLATGTTNFAIVTSTQTAANCTVGMITKTGTFSPSNVSSCTVIGTD